MQSYFLEVLVKGAVEHYIFSTEEGTFPNKLVKDRISRLREEDDIDITTITRLPVSIGFNGMLHCSEDFFKQGISYENINVYEE